MKNRKEEKKEDRKKRTAGTRKGIRYKPHKHAREDVQGRSKESKQADRQAAKQSEVDKLPVKVCSRAENQAGRQAGGQTGRCAVKQRVRQSGSNVARRRWKPGSNQARGKARQGRQSNGRPS